MPIYALLTWQKTPGPCIPQLNYLHYNKKITPRGQQDICPGDNSSLKHAQKLAEITKLVWKRPTSSKRGAVLAKLPALDFCVQITVCEALLACAKPPSTQVCAALK